MKVLIIEDELPTQRMLADLVNEVEPAAEIVGAIDSVQESVQWLKTNPHPEIILMDIQLSDGISFEILKQVPVTSMIIFITAFDEYAIQAFKVNSLDYLLKPVDSGELKKAFEKYGSYSRNFLKHKNSEPNFEEIVSAIKNASPNYRKHFLIKTHESFFRLAAGDVAFFYSTNKITFAVTFLRREYPLDISLDNLREQLDPEQFFKINRQVIVNSVAIENIHAYFQGKLVVETRPRHSEKIIVGKDKAAEFKRWLDK
jgi:DNA-binding LytR/AlgR family response regulator